MMLQHFPARVILVGATAALVVIVVADGWLLSVVEDIAWLEGLWIAFNVVSTIGFGTGPQSAAGQLIVMAAFAGAAVCWFCVLLTAVELAQLRSQRSVLIHEARRSLRSTGGGRLFNRN